MMARGWWRAALDPLRLRELAGAGVYERGEQYFVAGRVATIDLFGETASATVRGVVEYKVKLWRRGQDLQWSCTCPFALEGAFCKHCVAVALAVQQGHLRQHPGQSNL